jgi:dolichol-phosphate mannosyltransferase
VGVNSLVLAALASGLGWWYLPASLIASEVAILWNFVLSERFVFDPTERELSRPARLASFVLFNTLVALMGSPLLIALVSGLALNVLVANAICLVLLCMVRFVVADRWIWGAVRAHPQPLVERVTTSQAATTLATVAMVPES